MVMMMNIIRSKGLSVVLLHSIFFLLIIMLGNTNVSYATLSDIHCLRTLKESVEDPLKILKSSWNFNNNTEGYICKFIGIECWHPDENKVLNIRLSDLGLKGHFPKGLENCSSMTGLDLSNNEFFGPIPSDISKRLPFLTSLDLSSNNFSGVIPSSLANCTYLNIIKLDHNRLTGQIPLQLGQLSRLKTFNVANNLLSGPIPTFANPTFGIDSYANNVGLCGKPLNNTCKVANVGLCGKPLNNTCKVAHSGFLKDISHTAFFIGLAVGLGYSVVMFNVFEVFKNKYTPRRR